MRYVAKQKGSDWVVEDTLLDMVVARYKDHDKAERETDKLNTKAPGRLWEVETAGTVAQLRTFLDAGYEPFAVDKQIYYLRKEIKK